MPERHGSLWCGNEDLPLNKKSSDLLVAALFYDISGSYPSRCNNMKSKKEELIFTVAEKEARHSVIRQMLLADDLNALLLIGDTNFDTGFCGHLRYYTNLRTVFFREAVVVFPDSEPVLYTPHAIPESLLHRQTSVAHRFVDDYRYSGDIIADVIKLLKQRGVSSGRIGINLELLSVPWYRYLKQELPQIEWVEMHARLMQIRFKHTQEEADVYRKGATLADGGFEAALKVIRPGVSEYEIVAEIEHFARARGAEENFSLIASGKFSFGDANTFPFLYPPSARRIEAGDSITMEITPRYEGYWTQLVRTVNVGLPNADVEKLHKVCCGAIRSGLEEFKPGKTVREVVLAIESYVNDSGYLLKPPLGHICGVDIVEARILRENEMVLELGQGVIIHPQICTPDEKACLLWGETYLLTEDGYERLNRAGDELYTL